ncbi:MAG: flagellar hook protein FlgE [Firmicutes bacterium]|nr:flagellar hook protein FlgE [Bacillota bacterium]
MMRSLFSGVSGLRIHQTRMDVIANNIANVNTVAFKSARVTFAEIFNQTVSGASAPNDTTGRGGVNPMQIGLGSSVASIDKLMTPGAFERTDNPLDMMVVGDGFFVVSDAAGTYFTRAGNFSEDLQGNLSLNGMKLMGWDAVRDPATGQYAVAKTAVAPVTVGAGKSYANPESTTIIDMAGNINPQEDPVVNKTMSFFDSVGNKYLMDVRLTYDAAVSSPAASVWHVAFPGSVVYANEDRTKPVNIAALAPFDISFDTNGMITSIGGGPVDPLNPASYTARIPVTPSARLDPSATLGGGTGMLNVNFMDLHQFVNDRTTAIATNRDGNAPGTLTGLNVGPDGKITGIYSNGAQRLLAQIPLAKFQNPAGLEKSGNNMYRASPNSGAFDGIGLEGNLQSGVLEMSNVDLSAEFTSMITTQRGFQANSRIITASDDMLQELVNLRR